MTKTLKSTIITSEVEKYETGEDRKVLFLFKKLNEDIFNDEEATKNSIEVFRKQIISAFAEQYLNAATESAKNITGEDLLNMARTLKDNDAIGIEFIPIVKEDENEREINVKIFVMTFSEKMLSEILSGMKESKNNSKPHSFWV